MQDTDITIQERHPFKLVQCTKEGSTLLPYILNALLLDPEWPINNSLYTYLFAALTIYKIIRISSQRFHFSKSFIFTVLKKYFFLIQLGLKFSATSCRISVFGTLLLINLLTDHQSNCLVFGPVCLT